MSSTLTHTTLSAAITANQTTFQVASTTNISAPTNNFFQKIYVLDPGTMRGELMTVLAIPSSGVITVSRLDQVRGKHLSGAIVIINPIDTSIADGFIGHDPVTVPNDTPILTWVLNVVTGAQWLWSTITNSWVPGFNNIQQPVISPTAAVASVAGATVPSGPLFHVTGTSAITSWTLPNGFTSGVITVIPDAVFTWTNAGNIALGGTAVVSKALTFTYDWNANKWYPSYIA